MDYLDENAQERDYKATFETFGEMNEYIRLPIKQTMQSDVRVIEKIKIWIRYEYKGDRKIESHNFTEYNKNYKPEALTKAYATIEKWIQEHPEVLL